MPNYTLPGSSERCHIHWTKIITTENATHIKNFLINKSTKNIKRNWTQAEQNKQKFKNGLSEKYEKYVRDHRIFKK